MVHFILASQSPRRQELLSLCGFPFQVMAAAVDEASIDIPDPAENTIRTARLKAEVVANNFSRPAGQRVIVIAADTTVALENQMLGKPGDSAEADQMLRALRSRAHTVYTGMVLLDVGTGKEVSAVHAASVQMRSYTNQEIENYIASGDPLDKAGAYAIQHPQFRPVAALEGCFLGVMGFSVCQFLIQLRKFNLPLSADMETLREAHNHYFCPILAELSPQA